MARLYKDAATGKTLHPVCGFAKNQHMLYNAYDRAWNDICDTKERGSANIDKLYNALGRIEKAIDAFDAHVINGLVYATYEDSCIIKDYIAAYNARAGRIAA